MQQSFPSKCSIHHRMWRTKRLFLFFSLFPEWQDGHRNVGDKKSYILRIVVIYRRRTPMFSLLCCSRMWPAKCIASKRPRIPFYKVPTLLFLSPMNTQDDRHRLVLFPINNKSKLIKWIFPMWNLRFIFQTNKPSKIILTVKRLPTQIQKKKKSKFKATVRY